MKISKPASKGATLVSMGILIALVAILAISSISILGNHINNDFSNLSSAISNSENLIPVNEDNSADPSEDNSGSLPSGDPEEDPNAFVDPGIYNSCGDAFYHYGIQTSGFYKIDFNGQQITHYCYMKPSGSYPGAFTLAALQYESHPAQWGEGSTAIATSSPIPLNSFSMSPDQFSGVSTYFTRTQTTQFELPYTGSRTSFTDILSDLAAGKENTYTAYNVWNNNYTFKIQTYIGKTNTNCDPTKTEDTSPDNVMIAFPRYSNRNEWQFDPNLDPAERRGSCYYGEYNSGTLDDFGYAIFVKSLN